MSNDETYNGWTNRETWAVALHINNDQGWQESIHETVRNTLDGTAQDPPTYIDAGDLTDVFYANRVGDAIRDNVEETLASLLQDVFEHGHTEPDAYSGIRDDLGSLWRVDWSELGRAFIADVTDE